jgi:hypothetical protein
MAKLIASQVGAWTKVTETVELEDTGNIMTPLIRVSMAYARKAASWETRAPKEDERKERSYSRRPLPTKPSTPEFYIRATESVDRLINGEAFNVCAKEI